ncbi:hypothetical protein COO60DRAFT_1113381 [Scenedesmus sp. NREL 46B-D3]|nr:hypothetical protein COO60DRAFT_1113381 [Scenedesmus sp. NREL 46B-D3]
MHHFNFGSGAFGGSSGAAPLRGGGHLPHSSSSANLHSQAQSQQQHKPRPHARLRIAAAAAAAATAGATGMHLHRQGQLSLSFLNKQQQHAAEAGKPFLIPRELAEVMAGAFAEIIQVAALYPIDTIKVRCQASGLPMSVVIRQLMASPATAVTQLYAGVVSASVASVAVGECRPFLELMTLVAASCTCSLTIGCSSGDAFSCFSRCMLRRL